jgi:hypothetical protein
MQIWFTPGMSYEGEKGLKDMTRKKITKSIEFAEFGNVDIHRFGMFPPAIYNSKLGNKVDHLLSDIKPLSPVMAFQLISATKPIIS